MITNLEKHLLYLAITTVVRPCATNLEKFKPAKTELPPLQLNNFQLGNHMATNLERFSIK